MSVFWSFIPCILTVHKKREEWHWKKTTVASVCSILEIHWESSCLVQSKLKFYWGRNLRKKPKQIMNKNFPFCQITVRLHLQKINQVIVSPEFSLNIVLLLYFTNPVQCPVIQYKPVKSKSKLLNIMQKLIPLTPRTKGFQQGSYTQSCTYSSG